MTDFLSPAERSDRMSRIRSKDTQPELALRKVLHRLGLRSRLHGGQGSPASQISCSHGTRPWSSCMGASGIDTLAVRLLLHLKAIRNSGRKNSKKTWHVMHKKQ